MPRTELPEIDERLCTACGDCVRVCPTECLRLERQVEVVVVPQRCISCTVCEAVCPTAAIAMHWHDW